MCNEDGRVWLVYNGEIYNFRELRRELLTRGHQFRSTTDSEVLVHLYEEHGERLVDHLRGMFSFAIWDSKRHLLLLARDRFGIKPLYYARTRDGGLVFASEIKAILASGEVERRADPAALSEYLAIRYTTGERTLFRDIFRLLPGHIGVWRGGAFDTRKYWEFPARARVSSGSRTDLIDQFRARFDESVQLRMISDAPIGVFLSGGIDSTAIACVMAEKSDEPITTFSVGYKESASSELPYARRVAAQLGARHQEVVVSARDFFEALPRLVWHEDEPVAFPSSIPLYFVSELAREYVKVVLTGEGSDELLAGYGKYLRGLINLRAGHAYEYLPELLRSRIRGLVDRLPRGRLSSKLARTFLARPATVESLCLASFSVFEARAQRRVLTPEFHAQIAPGQDDLDPFAGHREILAALRDLPLLQQLLALDWQTYLQELLMKQDQMSMAASIESRVPYLDQEFATFVAGLPRNLKLKGLTTKKVLRAAMRDKVPDFVLKRRKMGFPTPLGQWLRGEFTSVLDETVLSQRAQARGIFDPAGVRQLVEEHRSGALDHTERLWALMNVELWYRGFLDEPADHVRKPSNEECEVGKAALSVSRVASSDRTGGRSRS